MAKGSHSRSHHKDIAHLSVHDDHVVKRSADGSIAVIGHGHQDEDLSGSKEVGIKHLGHTAVVGDGLLLGQQVSDQFGCHRGGEADPHQGQIAEKKYMGCSLRHLSLMVRRMSRFPERIAI